jgi:diguanylate cyclase (GGDEF)-like protein
LQKIHYSLAFSKSDEDSLRIVSDQSIDVVFLSLPADFSESANSLFLDFFSVLKQLCGVIPIIGVIESEDQKIPPIKLDDIVDVNVNQETLISRMNALIKMKDLFDDSLLGAVHLDESDARKIVAFFYDNVDFLPKSVLTDAEIVMIRTWPTADSFSDADLFLINTNHHQAKECCAGLSLRKVNKYKPIFFTFDGDNKDNIDKHDVNLGFTDILNVKSNPSIVEQRLNSAIRYKKLYETFSKKLRKSLYLSAIDSTTEAYNRSFLEDYLKNVRRDLSNVAVIMLDVDKFKSINDKFGHSFADSMLKHVSNVIKRYIRASDIIARYGGDEFVVIMNDVTKAVAHNIAERIRERIDASAFGDAQCAVSIGLCCVEMKSDASLYEAILIADKFMYAAKQAGGNSVKICM